MGSGAPVNENATGVSWTPGAESYVPGRKKTGAAVVLVSPTTTVPFSVEMTFDTVPLSADSMDEVLLVGTTIGPASPFAIVLFASGVGSVVFCKTVGKGDETTSPGSWTVVLLSPAVELSTGTRVGKLLRRFHGYALIRAVRAMKSIALRMYMVVTDHPRIPFEVERQGHPYIVFKILYVPRRDESQPTDLSAALSLEDSQHPKLCTIILLQSLQLTLKHSSFAASAPYLLPFTSASTIRLYPAPLPLFPSILFLDFQDNRVADH